jgi:hypothetical protein
VVGLGEWAAIGDRYRAGQTDAAGG